MPWPVCPGLKCIRAHIEHRRVVQSPLDRIPGTRHHPQLRRFPRLGYGRLATIEREGAGLVRHPHGPLKYRQEGLMDRHTDEKLRSPDPCNGKGGTHFQAAGTTAEEMCGPLEQTDQRGAFFLSRLRA